MLSEDLELLEFAVSAIMRDSETIYRDIHRDLIDLAPKCLSEIRRLREELAKVREENEKLKLVHSPIHPDVLLGTDDEP